MLCNFGSLTGSSYPKVVDRYVNPDYPSPLLCLNYQASQLIRDGPPLCLASVLRPLSFSPLGFLPFVGREPCGFQPTLYRDDRFPRSIPKPKTGSRRLNTRHHLGSRQVSPRLIPKLYCYLGFDAVHKLSTRHQWFAFARLPESHLTDCLSAFSITLNTLALYQRT